MVRRGLTEVTECSGRPFLRLASKHVVSSARNFSPRIARSSGATFSGRRRSTASFTWPSASPRRAGLLPGAARSDVPGRANARGDGAIVALCTPAVAFGLTSSRDMEQLWSLPVATVAPSV